MNLHEVLTLLFPAQCGGCNALGTGLCERCAPLTSQTLIRRLPSLRVRAFGAYAGALKKAIVCVKDGRRDVAHALGERCARLVDCGALLVPVPTTLGRRRVRGIDGVAEIAAAIAVHARCSVMTALAQRRGDAQRGRSRRDRLEAHGRFACDPAVAGRHVVLVDDVCTTGATLEDCAAAIRAVGGSVEEAVLVALA